MKRPASRSYLLWNTLVCGFCSKQTSLPGTGEDFAFLFLSSLLFMYYYPYRRRRIAFILLIELYHQLIKYSFYPNPPSLLIECLRQRTFLPPWAWPPSLLCRSLRSAAAWAFGPSTWRLGVSNYLPIMPRKTFSQHIHIHTHVHVHVLVSFENI